MHIIFERSGGFAGMTSSYSFDVDDLPDSDAENIRRLIDQVNFATLPKQLTNGQNLPDQFTYSITVQSQEWQRTIVTGDLTAPEEIQPLIETLNSVSRSQRR